MNNTPRGFALLTYPLLPMLLLLMLSAMPVSAEWTGGIEGGTVLQDSGGATRVRLKLSNNDRPLNHSFHVDWYRNGSGDNSYEAGYTPRYWLDDSLYLFGEARIGVDKPRNIDREGRGVLGLGKQFLATDIQSLSAEIGVGSLQRKFTESTGLEDTSDVFALARADYSRIIAQSFRVELDLDWLQGEEQTDSTAEIGVSANLAGGSIKVSYRTRRVKFEDLPAVTDSDTFVSFGYGF